MFNDLSLLFLNPIFITKTKISSFFLNVIFKSYWDINGRILL